MTTRHYCKVTLQRVLKVLILIRHVAEAHLHIFQLSEALLEQYKHTLELSHEKCLR